MYVCVFVCFVCMCEKKRRKRRRLLFACVHLLQFQTVSTSNSLSNKWKVCSTSIDKQLDKICLCLQIKVITAAITVIYTLQRMNKPLHLKKKKAAKLVWCNVFGRYRFKQTVNQNNADEPFYKPKGINCNCAVKLYISHKRFCWFASFNREHKQIKVWCF